MSARASYARATAGYDEQHEQDLVNSILEAICETSRVSDANCIALRTSETATALLSVLTIVLSMSPAATRSPTALRHLIDSLGKKLRRQVAAATNDPDVADFLRGIFRSTDVGGSA